jgi:hypothetical protein
MEVLWLNSIVLVRIGGYLIIRVEGTEDSPVIL